MLTKIGLGRLNRQSTIGFCAAFILCALAGNLFAETQQFRHAREVLTTAPLPGGKDGHVHNAGSVVSFPSSQAETVRYVIDGDTVVLADGVSVRLIGINAPEIDHPKYGKIGEPFGPDSAKYLRDLVEGKSVRLESGTEPLDRYGRRLAYIFRDDGLFVNRRMVEAGYAETFRRFDFVYKKEFLTLEAKARQEHLGMWKESPDSWKDQFIHWLSEHHPKPKVAAGSPGKSEK